MAGVIASIVAPHTPRIGIEANAPAFQRGLIDGERELGERLRGMRPDLFILQSSHWVSTFNWYATGHAVHEGICVADEAPDMIPGIHYRRQGDPDYARALVEQIRGADIPCGLNESPHFHWDYGSFVPLQYLDPDAEIPVVLLPTVICSDLDENIRVGQLVHDTAVQTGRRVVFIASCALSHKVIRGPELWPSQEMQDMDHRFVDLLVHGRIDEIAEWIPAYSRDAVAEMGGRPLCGMLGSMQAMARDAGTLAGRQYGAYAQSSGSGNATVCVTPAAAQ
jgi:3,4-dihydroxyphenylacetate 2,3-dioxygenase